MFDGDPETIIPDLADGTLSGREWDAWLADHPEIAAEVAIARRVRALMVELRASEIAVPAGFEERLLARVRADRTLLDLLDLGLSGLGRALLELLGALFALVPEPSPAPA